MVKIVRIWIAHRGCPQQHHSASEFAEIRTMKDSARASYREELSRKAIQLTRSWWLPAFMLLLTSIMAIRMQPLLVGEVSSGLIFVIGITVIGATSGMTAALVSAVVSAAIFNFFLASPVLTFRMSTGKDLAPPLIFTACAIASGLLAGRLKDQTSLLGQANLQLESLLETSRMLQAAPDSTAIQAALERTLPVRLGIGFVLWLFVIVDGKLYSLKADASRPDMFRLANEVIGGEDAVLAGESSIAYRLDGSRSCVGALVVENVGGAIVDTTFFKALASMVGLALERPQLASVIARTEARARTEELKSALLSSVSHDLRTPLTIISASASSLIEFGSRFDGETSRVLLRGIVEECNRLNRFTSNLLELSRLQSGRQSLRGQVLSVNDLLRSVVKRLNFQTMDHRIEITTTQQDMLVTADTALFELALTNIIQNALLYSEPDSTVSVKSDRDGQSCVLTVTDEGCGIPEAEQSLVFDRFYRVKRNEASSQGSGLGLAIAKGFVEAFDGLIELTSPVANGKGTSVTIRLPLVEEAAT